MPRLHNMLPFRAPTLLGLSLLSFSASAADALHQTYCSSENTASDNTAVSNIYNSNGACHDQCFGNYAFAVVQYQICWCSNYAPADTSSVSDCSQACPGYPNESCGNLDNGLYGYIQLSIAPSGTAGGSSSSPSSSSSTAVPSSTEAPETSTVSSVTPADSTQRTSSTAVLAPLSTSSSSSTWTPTPVTSVIMTTISGAVVTQTVTSTPLVAPNSEGNQIPIQRDDRLGAGAIAGIVIGILFGFALLALGAFLLWRRKKAADTDEAAPGEKKNIGRNVSVLSKAGLLSRPRPSMGEREHEDSYHVNPATGQSSVRHSMMFGAAASEGVAPSSPLGSSNGSNNSRRQSRPMVYDQRLNPSALFANPEANGSRVSMQDQQDYSRPLGVINPDPRASFESRVSRA